MTSTMVYWLDRTSPDAERFRVPRLLTENEHQRRDRYRLAEDRDRFTLGRGLARTALAALSGKAAQSIGFTYGAYGRPEWEGREHAGPWFNIAHGGDLVVVGVSNSSPAIGVDVEPDDRAIEIDAMLDMVCGDAERDVLRRLSEDKRRTAFLRFWTLKEAYLKATGLGLQRDPRRQTFVLDPEVAAATLDLAEGEAIDDWRFMQWQPDPRHHLAVATHRVAGGLPVLVPARDLPGSGA